MFFEDLSLHTYLNREPNPDLITVGWLDAEHDFPKGKVSKVILEKILALCFKPVNSTRGIHSSPFAPANPYGYLGYFMNIDPVEVVSVTDTETLQCAIKEAMIL
jgi:hypothetical protein